MSSNSSTKYNVFAAHLLISVRCEIIITVHVFAEVPSRLGRDLTHLDHPVLVEALGTYLTRSTDAVLIYYDINIMRFQIDHIVFKLFFFFRPQPDHMRPPDFEDDMFM